MSKKISVIIPAYNVENYLKECLDSVIGQDNGQIEIILVDDGSQDSTPKLCEEYSAKYPIIRYFAKENEGPSATRNFGINKAEGEYLLFLDSDDLIGNTTVESVIKIIDAENPDVIITRYCSFEDSPENAEACGYHLESQKISEKRGEELLSYLMDGRVYDWYSPIHIVKTSLIRDNELYFPVGVDFGEDARLIPKILITAKKLSYLDEPVYMYRRNRTSSITASFSKKFFEGKIGLFADMEKFCAENKFSGETRNAMFTNMCNMYVSTLFDAWYFPAKERNDYLRKLRPYKFILKNSVRTYHRLLFAFWSVFGVKLTSYILYLRAAKIRGAIQSK